MLNKLLKYDFKAMAKSLIPFYGLIVLLSILVRITGIIKEHFSITSFIYAMMLVFFIILIVAIILYTFFISIKRFYQTTLKDEGYLTHTLPVKRSNIILSQTIASLVFFLISCVVLIVSLIIAFYTKGSITHIFKALNELFTLMEVSPTISYIYTIIIMISGYMSYVLIFYLSLILGHQKSKNKIVYSIVYGLVIYCILQVLSFISLGIAILFDHNLITVMQYENATFKQMASVLITSGILNVLIPFASYFISCKAINTKLNLE